MNINVKYKSRRHDRISKKFYQYEVASTCAVGARDSLIRENILFQDQWSGES